MKTAVKVPGIPLLLAAVLLWGAAPVRTDFQEYYWDALFVYHRTHELLLAVFEHAKKCYVAHVDAPTRDVFETCDFNFLEQDIYDTIQWNGDKVVNMTKEELRDKYQDVLANYRCSHSAIYALNITYGADYISNCQPIG